MLLGILHAQSPSFLDYPVRMQKAHGKNTAQSIFSIHQIPTTHHICNLLDRIPLKTVFALLVGIGDGLYQQGYLESFRAVGGTLLAALDGTDFFASEKSAYPCCTRQTLNNDKTLYRHTTITPVLVAPGQTHVLPLPPAFVQSQDGQEKQDCEAAAAKRRLSAWRPHYAA